MPETLASLPRSAQPGSRSGPERVRALRVPGGSARRAAQWVVPLSWRPMTPAITSEIETSLSTEELSPRKSMP
ncbi:hypothetical protein GCM10010519_53000 [Streptomyces lactacystinicus]